MRKEDKRQSEDKRQKEESLQSEDKRQSKESLQSEKQTSEEKRSGAMRIFGALSSVDGELLERSETSKKVIPFRKYSGIVAACLCFVVLGAAVWTGHQLGFVAENRTSDCAMPEMAENAAVAQETELTAGWESEMEPAEGAEEAAMEEAVIEEAGEKEIAEGAEQNSDTLLDWGPVNDAAEELTEAELRETEILGEYIPTEIPSGYVFEAGYRYDGEEDATSISVTWVKGMDSIFIGVQEYTTEADIEGRLADVSKPETYDVHLYEIPYCDTLPGEYREIFEHPIFAENDLTPEVVEARMKSVSDKGDTDTPRGNFAVLYDTGVVVTFSGRGDAGSIWEMFRSIKD